MKNQVQLIAYADRLGGTMRALHGLLTGPLRGTFVGLHLLPFFHRIDGADAGFDPIDHTAVDSRLGTWEDVRALARDIDLMADVIVNHISTSSPQFQDFSRRGAQSPHAGLFLTLDAVFPGGAQEKDLLAIYRPRPGLPFTTVTLNNGTRRILWTTFTPQQVDIDVTRAPGRDYLDGILRTFAANGIRMVRLDAIGYAVKKAGADCFMMPETFDFIADFSNSARRCGLEVLVEVHSHYRRQIDVAAHVDWVYDFALPPLVLHAISCQTSQYLQRWIGIRPTNCLTVLDTHDGIGMIDAGPASGPDGEEGLLPQAELNRLVEQIHRNTGGGSQRATGSAAQNLDLYQVNCAFYEALGRDDSMYLLARAIQFFLPGIPQVYYVGLLAGTNDMELLARTGVGRDINRHYYDCEEVERNLQRPVVAGLLELIRLRNAHPAFGGIFQPLPSPEDALQLRWQQGSQFAHLSVRFKERLWCIEYSEGSQHLRFPAG